MFIHKDIKNLPQFNNPIITIGSFDGVHYGHRKIIDRMVMLAKESNSVSVVITFYPHPRAILDNDKNSIKLLTTQEEKYTLLEKSGIDHLVEVPFTVEFSQWHPREYIEKFIVQRFHPSYIVIGYDHRFGLHRLGDIQLLKEYESTYNYTIIEIPKQESEEITISSSNIRKYIQEGQFEEARQLLQHPYLLTGKVIHGDKVGTKIGFPTANIKIANPAKLLPPKGVYAVQIDIEHVIFDGMLYIGTKPTITLQNEVNIEVNIFDFNQNIYDKNITVYVIKKIREDIKFDKIEDLIEQLKIDKIEATQLLQEWTNSQSEVAVATIAVLNHNGEEYLESFLPQMDYSSDTYSTQLLVIDNGSTDESVDYIKQWHPEATLIELSQNYGYAAGYNLGLKAQKSKYLVIINSDVLVTNGWLTPILDRMESDPKVGIVQPKILSLENKKMFEYAGACGGFIDFFGYPFCRGRIFDCLEKDDGQYDEPQEIFWASGAALVIRTDVFHKIGGFDPLFFAHQEEIDLCWRVKRAGYSVLVHPQSKVYHLGGGTLNYGAPQKIYLNFRNNLMLLTKNHNLIKLLWLIPLKLILDGIAGLVFLAKGHFMSTWAIVKAHLHFYALLPSVLERRNADELRIFRTKKGQTNKYGRYNGSILLSYFLFGRKKFNQLNKEDFSQ